MFNVSEKVEKRVLSGCLDVLMQDAGTTENRCGLLEVKHLCVR